MRRLSTLEAQAARGDDAALMALDDAARECGMRAIELLLPEPEAVDLLVRRGDGDGDGNGDGNGYGYGDGYGDGKVISIEGRDE